MPGIPDRPASGSSLLAERWSIIIILLRNIILVGCRTFNEIADGAPGLSRGLLSKRLRELQRAGVIEIRPKPDGPGGQRSRGPSPGGISERLRWGDALCSGAIEVRRSNALARALLTWNRRVEPVQHQRTRTPATVPA